MKDTRYHSPIEEMSYAQEQFKKQNLAQRMQTPAFFSAQNILQFSLYLVPLSYFVYLLFRLLLSLPDLTSLQTLYPHSLYSSLHYMPLIFAFATAYFRIAKQIEISQIFLLLYFIDVLRITWVQYKEVPLLLLLFLFMMGILYRAKFSQARQARAWMNIAKLIFAPVYIVGTLYQLYWVSTQSFSLQFSFLHWVHLLFLPFVFLSFQEDFQQEDWFKKLRLNIYPFYAVASLLIGIIDLLRYLWILPKQSSVSLYVSVFLQVVFVLLVHLSFVSLTFFTLCSKLGLKNMFYEEKTMQRVEKRKTSTYGNTDRLDSYVSHGKTEGTHRLHDYFQEEDRAEESLMGHLPQDVYQQEVFVGKGDLSTGSTGENVSQEDRVNVGGGREELAFSSASWQEKEGLERSTNDFATYEHVAKEGEPYLEEDISSDERLDAMRVLPEMKKTLHPIENSLYTEEQGAYDYKQGQGQGQKEEPEISAKEIESYLKQAAFQLQQETQDQEKEYRQFYDWNHTPLQPHSTPSVSQQEAAYLDTPYLAQTYMKEGEVEQDQSLLDNWTQAYGPAENHALSNEVHGYAPSFLPERDALATYLPDNEATTYAKEMHTTTSNTTPFTPAHRSSSRSLSENDLTQHLVFPGQVPVVPITVPDTAQVDFSYVEPQTKSPQTLVSSQQRAEEVTGSRSVADTQPLSFSTGNEVSKNNEEGKAELPFFIRRV